MVVDEREKQVQGLRLPRRAQGHPASPEVQSGRAGTIPKTPAGQPASQTATVQPPLPRFPLSAHRPQWSWEETALKSVLTTMSRFEIRACRRLGLAKISPIYRAETAAAVRSRPVPPRLRPQSRTLRSQYGWCSLCHVKGGEA